jgi:hypothetical protein
VSLRARITDPSGRWAAKPCQGLNDILSSTRRTLSDDQVSCEVAVIRATVR